MEIQKIFENLIKIEPKVMSIESLFSNQDRVDKTNYKPPYQRNYVWDDEKATYFIESILLGTEIPPLIYFRNSDKVEIIDGRQRYQTILRFIGDDFKLKPNGLQKLGETGISNKYFKNIGEKLTDLFWDTKLRIIEFSFHSKEMINDEIEEIVKKEIFKRYNSGITPLKPTDIAKAAYFEDDLNTYIKNKLTGDKLLYQEISSLFHFERINIELILKKIRQLLVQHQIPIKYYSIKKDTIISKYYELLYSNIQEEEIEQSYSKFIEKINVLKKIQKRLSLEKVTYNRLISECLFWALSILESEEISLKVIDKLIIDQLTQYISENISDFSLIRSFFSKEIYNRYEKIAIFFNEKFGVNFNLYLYYNSTFKEKNKEISPNRKDRISFDELRINKPEPSSIAIVDISRQMERQRFLIRPPYQRSEVINKKKSSSIIESILLGIKLPPIFVFKREDGISEVLDGQQRLLSILGFMQESYLDENNRKSSSSKNGYSLSLRNSILDSIDGKKFLQLDQDQQDKIKNFDLWVIEINQKYNQNFEPIDLFIRLNNKPYPIKEDTFEMWNSYISRELIESIKSVHNKNKDWFYLRKNNSRMEDENIYTSLIYLQFSQFTKGLDENHISKELDVYKVVNKINFRVKSKNEISKVLEDVSRKDEFIRAVNDFEFDFLKNLRELLTDESDKSNLTINKTLDSIFIIENGRRTQQSFYALWSFLNGISNEVIITRKAEIRSQLRELFDAMSGIESKPAFDRKVKAFKQEFGRKNERIFDNELEEFGKVSQFAPLGEIATITGGVNKSQTSKAEMEAIGYKFIYYFNVKIDHFKIVNSEMESIHIEKKLNLLRTYESKNKIVFRRSIIKPYHFSVATFYKEGLFSNDFLLIILERTGFLKEFVCSILGSKMAFYSLSIRPHDDGFQISVTDIRNVKIPIININEQVPFKKVVELIQMGAIQNVAMRPSHS
ncbi:GmrSD restriction endonuclease domain-containing protein [Spirosoma spitsbergense]|uniref:GmrSD restriction endonuclease domain-containing protein n=1 Tax=Spirosoma spitsbergense TaxID=431554 RepID=UPI0012FAC447|nr:DUF262 domain-containing protein [Spirosoma spitsbergense]